MHTNKSRIARKHVNVIDAVIEDQRTVRPRFLVIKRVDIEQEPRMVSGFHWSEGTHVRDLVGTR